MSKPPVIVLAAGESSRMFPLHTLGHKSMIPICGETLLSRTLTNLHESGYKKIYLVIQTGLAENQQLLDWVASVNKNDLDITLITQDKALGMGNALLTARKQAPELLEAETFAVVGPYTFQAAQILDRLQKTDTKHSVLVTETEEPWNYGIVEVKDDKAVSIVEKPAKGTEPSNLKIQLTYLLGASFWKILESTEETQWSFETALNTLMSQEAVATVQIDEALPTLKYSWNLFAFLKLILHAQPKTRIHPKAKIAQTAVIDDSKGAVVIEEGATVCDFVKIGGPMYIGKNAFVGDYSLVRESSIEENATVGAKTEVARSLLMSGSSIHYGYIADSILATKAKIGAGLITANKRLDRNTISTLVWDKMVQTNISNFGTIIGQNSKVGIGVGIMPGILIAADSQVLPGEIVSKNIM